VDAANGGLAVTVGAWLCLLAPLAGCLLIVLAGTSISRRAAAVIGTLSVFVGFAGAVVAFVDMVGKDAEERTEQTLAWTWLQAGDFEVGLELLVDPLSAVMMLIVSGVGGLIVWYSVGYMDGDDEERRYFAYMALFVFSMLLLVEAGNFLILLAGWGLVGLASYLLIGFWHERPEAVAAAKKAFIMNAVGDATMAMAFFLLIQQTGTLSFAPAFEAAEGGELSSTVITLVALGLLGGAVAKSAQIPLHTWLPDAMEGPTPVSALIHAATMVTAGVYLIARTGPVFEASDGILELAAILGAITLLVAGLVALVQTDIKRVIAYSTMSQIGYMFVGVGVGAYASGIFHLMTHAFFKALLFLAAGLVIHQLAGEQDIRKMGGLREVMPRTALAFLVGSLALVGIIPFSGFFSKDPILAAAWETGGYGYALFAAGLVGAFFTGIYAFRLYFVVFGGERSAFVEEHAMSHGHGEGPRSMTVPVAILTVLAAVGGLIQIPGLWHPLSNFLDPVVEPLVEPSVTLDWLTSLVAVAAGLAGIGIAWTIYGVHRRPVPRQPFLQRALEHKLWFDELYDALLYQPADRLVAYLRGWFEEPIIQGSITEVVDAAQETGTAVGEAQTGFLRSYALAIALSVAVLVVVFVSVQ
jgi:NADH-quinone oxidoreductase subunit L